VQQLLRRTVYFKRFNEPILCLANQQEIESVLLFKNNLMKPFTK